MFKPLDKSKLAIPRSQFLFRQDGSPVYRNLGDVSGGALALTLETSDYYSNEYAVRQKTSSFVTQKSGRISMTLMSITETARLMMTMADEARTVGQAATQVSGTYALEEGDIVDLGYRAVTLDSVLDAEGGDPRDAGTYKLDGETGLLEVYETGTYVVSGNAAATDAAIYGMVAGSGIRGALIARQISEYGPRAEIRVHDVEWRPSGDVPLQSEGTAPVGVAVTGEAYAVAGRPAWDAVAHMIELAPGR